MIPQVRNRLHTRRGFLNEAMRSAKVAGATGVLAAVALQRGKAAGEKNPWAYDVGRFLTTDPKLVGYRQVRAFNAPRDDPRCLALGPEGHLLVLAGKFVVQVKPDGSVVSEFPLGAESRCLACVDDRIHVAMRDHVEVFDLSGNKTATWEAAEGRPYFTGIAVGQDDVFVADAGNRIVLRYDRAGKLTKRIGKRDRDRGIPGFIVPSPFFSVVLGQDGLLRVTNPGRHRVELYTREGKLELAWGKPGAAIQNFCGCCNPIDLLLLPGGETVTFEKGIPRVKVYSATGDLETVVAGPESFAKNAEVCGPNDCTVGGMDGVVDAAGRICILDFVTAEVRVMERKEGSA